MDIMNLVLVSADISTFCDKTEDVWKLLGTVVLILQIAIPAIIILLGTIDLGKAVMAGDDKQIKEAQKMFIKRLIYGVAVFFVIAIVKGVFALVGNSSSAVGSKCFSCVARDDSCK